MLDINYQFNLYDKQHLKLIDFSLGGNGVEIGSILPPEKFTT